ncbi:hypothetical protein SAMN05216500_104171 [Acinetobacter sp. DSM 11652]|nr:hypothetical protein SAMN05216500_104171 [Acinetobacter sp. DSM 11652]
MIETERLILRQWQEADYSSFIKMGLDPDVMKYFHEVLTHNRVLRWRKKFMS